MSAGLQLGLGLLMAMGGVKLILQTPVIGFAALAVLGRIPHCPAALLVLAGAATLGWADGSSMAFNGGPAAPALPQPTDPERARNLAQH